VIVLNVGLRMIHVGHVDVEIGNLLVNLSACLVIHLLSLDIGIDILNIWVDNLLAYLNFLDLSVDSLLLLLLRVNLLIVDWFTKAK